MHHIGALLEAGGNKVFFVNGVLSVLAEQNIHIDYLVGYSSAAPIVLAHFSARHTDILNDFAARLDANPQNFYWFKRPHFPQDRIYGNAVTNLVTAYRSQARDGKYTIYGAASAPNAPVFKSLATSNALLFRYSFGINFLGLYRRMLGIRMITATETSDYTADEFSRFIMGTSSLYPFISYYTVRGELILEGAVLEITPEAALSNCSKKIMIHTERGATGAVGDIFHIYADAAIPNNVLDYTSGAAITSLHAHGADVMRRNIDALRTFLV